MDKCNRNGQPKGNFVIRFDALFKKLFSSGIFSIVLEKLFSYKVKTPPGGSILLGRALAPIDLMIGSWKQFLGIWPVANGAIHLDGADVGQFERGLIGPHIGYLPQDIELFDGTIAENIARFGDLNANKIFAAAQADGAVHIRK